MLTTDHFFLFYFFPVFLLIYYSLRRQATLSNIAILIFSLLFYASFGVNNVIYLVVPLILDYYLGRYIYSSRNSYLKWLILTFQVSASLLLLAYFKYTILLPPESQPFFERFNLDFVFNEVIAPVGISFLTFQRISYIVDIYRGVTKPAASLLQYFVYAAYFPQLIAGPIVRFNDIKDEVYKRTLSFAKVYEGLKYFSIGLFLKAFIADKLFPVESLLTEQLSDLNTVTALLLILTFSLRIYFDFLAYSLIAIGIGAFTGFSFPDNFASPYRSSSLQEFWRRWNITLSFWIRDYVYIPLGGNRLGTSRTYGNLVIAMMLAGLWHGASWTFLLWGLLHGIGLVVERLIKRSKISWQLPMLLQQLWIFIVVTGFWIPFKFTTIPDVTTYIKQLSNIQFTVMPKVVDHFHLALPVYMLALFWILYASETEIKSIPYKTRYVIIFSILLFMSMFQLLLKRGIDFIYFQF